MTDTQSAPKLRYERGRQITLPGLSFKGVERRVVKFLGKIMRSEKVDQADDGREPASVARVLWLDDGKEYRLICPTLLVTAMQEEAEDYVGQWFEITSPLEPRPGKRYRECEVYAVTVKDSDIPKG